MFVYNNHWFMSNKGSRFFFILDLNLSFTLKNQQGIITAATVKKKQQKKTYCVRLCINK